MESDDSNAPDYSRATLIGIGVLGAVAVIADRALRLLRRRPRF